jgi:hypothetical protein
VRCRIDFTYALGLDLDDPGFHHSVLSAFRDRLAEGDRADRLLGLALTRIRRAGLLKGRVTQRTDSPHVLSAAREPTRLDLACEASAPCWKRWPATRQRCWMSRSPPNGPGRYGRPVRLCSQPSHPVARLEQVGNDARELKALAEYLGHSDPGLTLKVYAHLMPSSRERARKALGQALRPQDHTG